MVTGTLSEEEKVIIKQMRSEQKSYGEIAKVLNCKLDRVKCHCARNGLAGYSKDREEEALNAFLNNLKEKHNNFEYVSGYVHSDSIVIVRCKQCGNASEKNAQFARKNIETICIHCVELRKEDNRIKQLREKILRDAVRTTRTVREVTIKRCKVCNSAYEQTKKGQRFCSKECSNKHTNRLKTIRRRKLRGNITLPDVIKKEGNVCYLCNMECDADDYKITTEGYFIVGKNYPSIEHVIPVSKGGEHKWDNIKLAHHRCNSIKNDKLNS